MPRICVKLSAQLCKKINFKGCFVAVVPQSSLVLILIKTERDPPAKETSLLALIPCFEKSELNKRRSRLDPTLLGKAFVCTTFWDHAIWLFTGSLNPHILSCRNSYFDQQFKTQLPNPFPNNCFRLLQYAENHYFQY
jgi:hypothetical protein